MLKGLVVDAGVDHGGGDVAVAEEITVANREHLSRQFGDEVCVSSTPIGPSVDADTCVTAPRSKALVNVPDLVGLSPMAADKRVRAAGLRLGGCAGATPARRPDRYSPDNALLVTEQCPRAGAVAPKGFGVAVRSEGRLPGGFRVVGTTDYGNARPCGSDRHETSRPLGR
jgi:hypothetical protein